MTYNGVEDEVRFVLLYPLCCRFFRRRLHGSVDFHEVYVPVVAIQDLERFFVVGALVDGDFFVCMGKGGGYGGGSEDEAFTGRRFGTGFEGVDGAIVGNGEG